MTAAEVASTVAVQGIVAAGMVEALIRLWRVEAPEQALQLRRLALALPVVVPAGVWAAAALGRSARAPALFEVRPWLDLTLPGGIPLGAVAGAVGLGVGALFAFQELFPALLHHRAAGQGARDYRAGELPALDEALGAVARAFDGRLPPVGVADDGGPMACVTGPRETRLVVSRRLVALLAPHELRAALAHEAAHAVRGDLRTGWAWFGLRALQCFSPAALLEFRWALEDQERACDRLAVARTGDPGALAAALRSVRAAAPAARPSGILRRLQVQMGAAWEDRLGVRRIEDLLREVAPAPLPLWRGRLAAAALAVGAVLILVR